MSAGRVLPVAALLVGALTASCDGCQTEPGPGGATRAGASSSTSSKEPSPSSPSDGCPRFDAGRVVGHLESPLLREASGLAASRRNPGILWAHNDSGHEGELYAIDLGGAVRAVYRLEGSESVDWEDIAVGDVGGKPHIFVADAGANKRPRESFAIYRVLEPEVRAEGPVVQGTLGGVEPIPFSYPGAESPDAEAIMIDPVTGDFILVTKSWTGESAVFRSALPEQTSSPEMLVKIADLRLPHDERRGSGQATAGDISSDGSQILLRTYTDIFWWRRAPGQTIAQALAGPRCVVPILEEPQGESVAFTPDGRGYLTVSEGAAQPLHLFRRVE